MKFTYLAVATLAAALFLTGCTPAPDAPAPSANSTPALPRPVTAEPAPEPSGPADQARDASGLSHEAYAALVADIATINFDGLTLTSAVPVFDGLAARHGKPVVIVEFQVCPMTALPAWGIAGALAGPTTGCGRDWTETLDGALAKVEERADRKGWSTADYAVVVLD